MGVGTVTKPAVKADQFMVASNGDGSRVPLTEATTSPGMLKRLEDDEAAEWIVGVERASGV